MSTTIVRTISEFHALQFFCISSSEESNSIAITILSASDFYENPGKFNTHRRLDNQGTLGFGYRPYRCQGQWLSRDELEIVFGTRLLPIY